MTCLNTIHQYLGHAKKPHQPAPDWYSGGGHVCDDGVHTIRGTHVSSQSDFFSGKKKSGGSGEKCLANKSGNIDENFLPFNFLYKPLVQIFNTFFKNWGK